jgi:integrase
MAKALTAKSVEQAKADGGRREIPDGLLGGLYLVVQPSGAKSWAVRYRHAGKPRKLTLGAYPALALGEAREAARAKLRAAAEGADPAAEKVLARQRERDAEADKRDHVETVVAMFVERHCKPRNRSWRETERVFRKDVLPHWAGRKVQSITRRDVLDLLDTLVDRGLGTGVNRVLAAVRRFFNWCVERDIIATSPAAGVKPPAPETSRDRVLSDAEIRLFWRATEALPYPFGPFGRALLLTAQRREEVAGMTRGELDGSTWTIPRARAKNNVEHTVPLSGAVASLLDALPRISGSAGFVFTSSGKTSISGFSKAKLAIDAKMLELARQDAVGRRADPDAVTIAPWVLHDLRRTAASGMARLGVAVHVVEAVLNHRSGTIRGVAAVYNRHSYADEKRRALEAWARHVEGLIAERPANVVALRTGRADG